MTPAVRRPDPLTVLSTYALEIKTGKHGGIARAHRTLERHGYRISDEHVRRIVSGNYRKISAPSTRATVTPPLDVSSTVMSITTPMWHVAELPDPSLWLRPDRPRHTVTAATAMYLTVTVITLCVVAVGFRCPWFLLVQAIPLLGLWHVVAAMGRYERMMR